MSLTQERLKELLHYDPETGDFTWIVSRGRVKKGSTAGTNHNAGYIDIRIDSNRYLAHRLAFLYMEGAFPEGQVDHKEGNRTDNRWIKLRKATNQENSKNTKIRGDNTSGITGISWAKDRSKWSAKIQVDGKTVHLGSFTVLQDAIDARKAAEIEHGFHKNHGRAA